MSSPCSREMLYLRRKNQDLLELLNSNSYILQNRLKKLSEATNNPTTSYQNSHNCQCRLDSWKARNSSTGVSAALNPDYFVNSTSIPHKNHSCKRMSPYANECTMTSPAKRTKSRGGDCLKRRTKVCVHCENMRPSLILSRKKRKFKQRQKAKPRKPCADCYCQFSHKLLVPDSTIFKESVNVCGCCSGTHGSHRCYERLDCTSVLDTQRKTMDEVRSVINYSPQSVFLRGLKERSNVNINNVNDHNLAENAIDPSRVNHLLSQNPFDRQISDISDKANHYISSLDGEHRFTSYEENSSLAGDRRSLDYNKEVNLKSMSSSINSITTNTQPSQNDDVRTNEEILAGNVLKQTKSTSSKSAPNHHRSRSKSDKTTGSDIFSPPSRTKSKYSRPISHQGRSSKSAYKSTASSVNSDSPGTSGLSTVKNKTSRNPRRSNILSTVEENPNSSAPSSVSQSSKQHAPNDIPYNRTRTNRQNSTTADNSTSPTHSRPSTRHASVDIPGKQTRTNRQNSTTADNSTSPTHSRPSTRHASVDIPGKQTRTSRQNTAAADNSTSPTHSRPSTRHASVDIPGKQTRSSRQNTAAADNSTSPTHSRPSTRHTSVDIPGNRTRSSRPISSAADDLALPTHSRPSTRHTSVDKVTQGIARSTNAKQSKQLYSINDNQTRRLPHVNPVLPLHNRPTSLRQSTQRNSVNTELASNPGPNRPALTRNRQNSSGDKNLTKDQGRFANASKSTRQESTSLGTNRPSKQRASIEKNSSSMENKSSPIKRRSLHTMVKRYPKHSIPRESSRFSPTGFNKFDSHEIGNNPRSSQHTEVDRHQPRTGTRPTMRRNSVTVPDNSKGSKHISATNDSTVPHRGGPTSKRSVQRGSEEISSISEPQSLSTNRSRSLRHPFQGNNNGQLTNGMQMARRDSVNNDSLLDSRRLTNTRRLIPPARSKSLKPKQSPEHNLVYSNPIPVQRLSSTTRPSTSADNDINPSRRFPRNVSVEDLSRRQPNRYTSTEHSSTLGRHTGSKYTAEEEDNFNHDCSNHSSRCSKFEGVCSSLDAGDILSKKSRKNQPSLKSKNNCMRSSHKTKTVLKETSAYSPYRRFSDHCYKENAHPRRLSKTQSRKYISCSGSSCLAKNCYCTTASPHTMSPSRCKNCCGNCICNSMEGSERSRACYDGDEQADDWVDEISKYRQSHWFDCHTFGDQRRLAGNEMGHELPIPNHKCTHRYLLNDRLFPTPVYSDHQGRSRCMECNMTCADEVRQPQVFPRDITLTSQNQEKADVKLPSKVSRLDRDMQPFKIYNPEKKLNGNRMKECKLTHPLTSKSRALIPVPANSLALRYQKGVV